MENIITSRLQMRPATEQDADFLLALLNSPGWLQYIGDRNVHSTEEAAAYITNRLKPTYEQYDYGLLVVETLDEKTPVGLCGIVVRDTLPFPDLGFAFLPEHQGKGYALEASQAIVEFAVGYTEIDVLLAIATPDNERSIKLLEKIGMTFEEEYTTDDTNEKLVRYRLALQ